jgi:hypothetical protein
VGQRTAKGDDTELLPRQQLLRRQLREEYKRKRAQMLFEYYSEDYRMAPREVQNFSRGLLLLDGAVKKDGDKGPDRVGDRGVDYQTQSTRPVLSIVQCGDSRRVEAGIPESVQGEEDEDWWA